MLAARLVGQREGRCAARVLTRVRYGAVEVGLRPQARLAACRSRAGLHQLLSPPRPTPSTCTCNVCRKRRRCLCHLIGTSLQYAPTRPPGQARSQIACASTPMPKWRHPTRPLDLTPSEGYIVVWWISQMSSPVNHSGTHSYRRGWRDACFSMDKPSCTDSVSMPCVP